MLHLLPFLIPVAAAEEAAEEFLLGDLGVRLDLPRGWRMTRWSDWDFKAQRDDGPVLLWAWASDGQVPIGGDASAWAPVYLAQIEAEQGKAPKFEQAAVAKVGGRDAALLELSFAIGKDRGTLYGATIEIEGRNFHLALIGGPRSLEAARAARAEVLERLDVRKGPATFPDQPTLEAKGVRTRLPAGWREPLKTEEAAVAKLQGQLGLEKVDECWTAIRPRPAADPDLAVTCQGGILLGVVDTYSAGGVAPLLAEKLFGKAVVPAPEVVELADRVGFVFAPKLGSRTLAVAVAPYDLGVSRTWVLSSVAEDASVPETARALLQNSTWSGPHPAGVGEWVSYYLTYRPFSPMVLGPVAGLGVVILAGIGLGVALTRRRKPELED
jgi:hypothetical protein